jgi:hypothetical protein
MKFLFGGKRAKRRSSPADAASSKQQCHNGDAYSSSVSSSGEAKKRTKTQQKRRKSLLQMDVPQAGSATTSKMPLTSAVRKSAPPSPLLLPSPRHHGLAEGGETTEDCTASSSLSPSPVPLDDGRRAPRRYGATPRGSSVSSRLTSSTRSSVTASTTGRTSSIASLRISAMGNLDGSLRNVLHDSLPTLGEAQQQQDSTLLKHPDDKTSNQTVTITADVLSTITLRDESCTEPRDTTTILPILHNDAHGIPLQPPKDVEFQLVPNRHKELGMVRIHYDCIRQATTQLLAAQRSHAHATPNSRHCPPQLKPILSIDVEIPGNVHIGNTIFSHPLIVEAMEAYFWIVGCPRESLPQVFEPNLQEGTVPAAHFDSWGRPLSSSSSVNNSPTNDPRQSTSKMGGNYLYTRVRMVDPLTGYDLVPCLDRTLTRATLLQAMMDALSILRPLQPIPRYLTNLLDEETAIANAARIQDRRYDLTYRPYHHHKHPYIPQQPTAYHLAHPPRNDPPQAPMIVFGLDHTALGEVVFADLEGVLGTQVGWVVEQHCTLHYNNSQSKHAGRNSHTPSSSSSATAESENHLLRCRRQKNQAQRQAVVLVTYDPQRLSYGAVTKFALEQHAAQRLGGLPSKLILYYESQEQHVTAMMHVKAYYRQFMDHVDPTNPALHYYGTNSAMTGSNTPALLQTTIPIYPLSRFEQDYPNSSTASSSTRSSSSSIGSWEGDGMNNSRNNSHPGYAVPDYDGVVEHAAQKAQEEQAQQQQHTHVLDSSSNSGTAAVHNHKPITSPRVFKLKIMSSDLLALQYSKPALRDTHLRFVPMTPYQAARANQLVHAGKFHLAMQLLSPRQGMVLMHALRQGKPRKEPLPALQRSVTTPVKSSTSTTPVSSGSSKSSGGSTAAANSTHPIKRSVTTPVEGGRIPRRKRCDPNTNRNASSSSSATTDKKSSSSSSSPSNSSSPSSSSVPTTAAPRKPSESPSMGSSSNNNVGAPQERRRKSSATTTTAQRPSLAEAAAARRRRSERCVTEGKPCFPKQGSRMSTRNIANMMENARMVAAEEEKEAVAARHQRRQNSISQNSVGTAASSAKQQRPQRRQSSISQKSTGAAASAKQQQRRQSSMSQKSASKRVEERGPKGKVPSTVPVASIITTTASPPAAVDDTASSPIMLPPALPPLGLAPKPPIVYQDVVDVPIMEAWKAFVVMEHNNPDEDGYDDDDNDDDDVYSEKIFVCGFGSYDDDSWDSSYDY